MSIPTTETQPDSLHRAPRNQSQQARKVLANAGPRQIHDFINDLIRRNQLNLNSIKDNPPIYQIRFTAFRERREVAVGFLGLPRYLPHPQQFWNVSQ